MVENKEAGYNGKPIDLWYNEVIRQEIGYIFGNPIEEGFVFRPADYKYSSVIDYAVSKEILDNLVVFQYFKL